MSLTIPPDKTHLIAETMSEDQLEVHVDAIARHRGILVLKIPDHVTKQLPSEWRGWPDRLFFGPEGFFWRELKSSLGRASRDQISFGHRISIVTMGMWDIWRPEDLIEGRIERELDMIR